MGKDGCCLTFMLWAWSKIDLHSTVSLVPRDCLSRKYNYFISTFTHTLSLFPSQQSILRLYNMCMYLDGALLSEMSDLRESILMNNTALCFKLGLSERYESGDRLIPEHENTILEKLLPFHPDFEKKRGCGIDYITIGYHPDFERSRCLFIVRKDGEMVDFSYWKCIKGLIRKNYPLYADSFILRHFRRRRRNF
ncbi:protein DCL, chloroplastic isoform X2 [Prosopis cineraria]|uniref:protein DCL, chloroplastic isoform X2 n=1 Tax=Prosopis cineraria TaxID=364024 RepID=UPI00241090F3|nr:protein DCL, chloroplastic isoform X2 [Prosopis cineraria]